MTAKIIMQQIWKEKIEWDQPISKESLRRWKSIQSDYQALDSIQIPRWFGYSPECSFEFHDFSDVSEKAYAAVLYILLSDTKSKVTHLVASKTRVAPIKTISIPRLELCGALLLTELIDSIILQLRLPKYSIHCWTDSTIVLSWLSKAPCHWTTFVANRISKMT